MEFPYHAIFPFASVDDAIFNHFLSLGAGALWTGLVVLRTSRRLPVSEFVWWHVPFLMLCFSTMSELVESGVMFCHPPEGFEWVCCAYYMREFVLFSA